MRWCSVLLMLCTTSLWAADPPPVNPPTPEQDLSVLVAPKEVSGTGKKLDPFVFTISTRCILRLTGQNTGVVFDIDDAPSDIEIIDNRYASFSLYEPGLYQLTAHGGAVYSKVWFQIKSGTDPPPHVDPAPEDKTVVGKLWVVIVKDGAHLSQLSSSQMQALLSTTVRDYCTAHCLKGTDGKTPEFKVYDKDTDVSQQSPAIQKAFKTAVEDLAKSGTTGPWLTVSNGKTGYSGPLPLTEATVIEKLKVYGGP
ncbi:MAG: hypothetical protein JWN70_4307 [Planctomycetaceae bacterium]|nr:hypothetical protein [Planctomycetaceae bacterium]